jgi:hypothetical protein
MSKFKIQPPTPFQLSINLIISLLLGRQRIPNFLLLPIPQNIINLRENKQRYTEEVDDDEVCVATMVEGLVVGAVDEVGADVAKLDGHVVEGCGDRAGADVVGVFRTPLECRS